MWIIGKGFVLLIVDVEGWVCYDEIYFFVDVLWLCEVVGVVFVEVVINVVNCYVYGGEFLCGGVEFLFVDGNVVDVVLMGGDKVFGLYEKFVVVYGWVIYLF